MMKRIHFSLSGMTCSNCVQKINHALENLDGVQSAEAKLDEQEVIVTVDEELSPMTIKKELEAINFQVLKFGRL